MDNLTTREVKYLNNINTETAKMKLGLRIDEMIDTMNDGVEGPAGAPWAIGVGTPFNAANASAKLTISGTANDGETISIGDEVYELDTDASVGEGNILVDISAGTKAQATVKLTLSGAVGEGETFSVGSETYEADYDGEVAAGNIQLDLSGAGAAAYAAGVLILTGDVADSETVTIGSTVFEFDTNNSITSGNIKVNVAGNVDKQSACIALATAIETELNGLFDAVASAEASDWKVTVTARIKGTHMNIISTTTCVNGSWAAGTLVGGADASDANSATIIITTFNAETGYDITAVADGATAIDFNADAAGAQDGSFGNAIAVDSIPLLNGAFGTANLAGGYDCTEAEAGAAILATINAESTIVDASDGGDNDVTVTAKWGVFGGTSGNDVAVVTDMANGAWPVGGQLAGGAAGTVGEAGDVMIDTTWFYVCIAENTVADGNWRRIALGAAY